MSHLHPDFEAVSQLVKSFQCAACQELLFEPVTLPCGSSVCKRCLRRPSPPKNTTTSVYPSQSPEQPNQSIPATPPPSQPSALAGSPCGVAIACDISAGSHTATSGTPSTSLPEMIDENAQAAVASVAAYVCPVKHCRKKHRYRNERMDVILGLCLERLFPVETSAYHLIKDGEERLNKYWNPDQSMCRDNSCLDPNSALALQAQQDKVTDLCNIISTFFEPAISNAPHLQLPIILRAKAYAELGRFSEASADARRAHELNPLNRRGLIAEKLVDWRRKMHESQLHLLATCAITALESGSGHVEEGKLSPETSYPTSVQMAAAQLRKEVCAAASRSQASGSFDDASASQRHVYPCSLIEVTQRLTQNLTQVASKHQCHSLPDTLSFLLPPSEFECHMCLSSMATPVTCPCGHTWCRPCLLRSLDVSRQCPMCRTRLPPIGYFIPRPTNKALSQVLSVLRNAITMCTKSESAAPDINTALPSASEMSGTSGFEMTERIPLFICSLVLPGSSQGFHMFEPRYRVMMKRCIESKQRFAITLPRPPNVPGSLPCMEYGTIAHITHFEPLIGGDIASTCDGNLPRYLVEVTGMHRVKIEDVQLTEAGYYEAVVRRVEDVEPDDLAHLGAIQRKFGSPTTLINEPVHIDQDIQMEKRDSFSSNSTTSSQSTTHIPNKQEQEWDPAELATYVYKARRFVSAIFSSLPPPARLHFERQHGRMPDDPSDLSFWLAGFLPLNPYSVYDVLPQQCVTERMRLLNTWIEKTSIRSS